MFGYAECMRSNNEVHDVFRLREQGLTQTEIAMQVGIGQTTVSRWLRRGEPAVLSSPVRRARSPSHDCPDRCHLRLGLPAMPYAYLLGQYLGDGYIVLTERGVYRLIISCCATYPDIVRETRRAIGFVMPNNAVGSRSRRVRSTSTATRSTGHASSHSTAPGPSIDA
jgi:hypothetical protein